MTEDALGSSGRIYFRPPENWAEMSHKEKLAWARPLADRLRELREAEPLDD